MKSFQITRFKLLEMINELFADSVVFYHHEKHFNEYVGRVRIRTLFGSTAYKNKRWL